MAGLKVVPIKSLADGSLDLVDLKAKAEQHKDNLAAFMVCRHIPLPIFDLLNATPRLHTPRHLVYLNLVFRMCV